MPSSFCFGEEWLLFTHHLNPSLSELISSFSYHASSPTLPLKLETEYREDPSLKPHLTTIALRRYLSSLSTHCTEEIPQLTLQASHTRRLLSSFLLPSTSAGSLHDQLAIVLSSYGLIQSFPTEAPLNHHCHHILSTLFGAGCGLPTECWQYASSYHSLVMIRRKQVLNFGSSGAPLTAALKSLIHPFAFSFKYPQITGLPHGLGGDLLLLVCLEPGAQQPRGLRFLNRLLHTRTFPLLHTMVKSSACMSWIGVLKVEDGFPG
ncbi:hypothetical protein F2Q69_00060133 [Brassica cretica]|uniref:Uncharacterized protein n=1 Tax=Brassica cretica TaxID=69181 RepID=A0A8S9RA91_BRACR|nr:hypothetical protein F2Q69_00060133 [Brassica cretica]